MTDATRSFDPRVQFARRGQRLLNPSIFSPPVMFVGGEMPPGLASPAQANQQNFAPVQLFGVVLIGSTDSWCGQHLSRDEARLHRDQNLSRNSNTLRHSTALRPCARSP